MNSSQRNGRGIGFGGIHDHGLQGSSKAGRSSTRFNGDFACSGIGIALLSGMIPSTHFDLPIAVNSTAQVQALRYDLLRTYSWLLAKATAWVTVMVTKLPVCSLSE